MRVVVPVRADDAPFPPLQALAAPARGRAVIAASTERRLGRPGMAPPRLLRVRAGADTTLRDTGILNAPLQTVNRSIRRK
ncbi:hypothetical protein GCM10010095_00130 [Streptomyces anthocyanicus]|uniref:Uncharacterized protein n=1 Tax=Streptomyces violaceolatus TaxID=67378 RepID=A0ABN3S3R3_9ACTN|nr:hypothetical protein JCM4020_06410 [Streptomyces coelicolor]BDE37362.1 hypothetical protein SLITK23_06070 [Streptomyces lividans]GGL19141.1 hypothetical protein GCM10010095_00130 [Streptomyces anthocyanicus]GHA26152.1 hypothetical protein GCM10010391_07290 [Streptomyces anthocyanicus]GHB90688.1 hypothetical protein GCM10010348_05830 [Streptomyces anthocyanicus]